jgi:brefeldin A-inhibited guanine nucleotide-exchange protein
LLNPIFRILNAFAQEYHNQNITVAPDAETIYMLVFAIVMLNADLHNAYLRVRMTKAQFVTMVKQVADACPVPILEEIYDRIAATRLYQP